MVNNPLVTIVTPSYNQGAFIEKTIVSVLNQSYNNIEYMVIDGCSNDDTLNILEKYKDKIKFVYERDNGQSDAINKGFRIASGEIVGWINSDDLLESNCVELIVNEFLENDNLGLVYGNYINIDKDGFKLNKIKNENISLYRLLNVDSGLSQPGSFYRRSFVQQVGFLDENLKYVMDYELWIKLLKISSIKYLDETLAYFRLHDQSKTVSQNDKFAIEIERVLNKYNGSVYALPSKYLKENYYNQWFLKMKKLIEPVFENSKNKNIGIYGAGTHTTSMLKVCDEIYGINKYNIFLFDSNKDKWSTCVCGYKVFPPDKINNFNLYKLIISSYTYQDEIYDQISKYCNEDVEIVKLYDKDDNSTFFI